MRPTGSKAERNQIWPQAYRGQERRADASSEGTGATEIAHQLSIARSTVYKILEDERAS